VDDIDDGEDEEDDPEFGIEAGMIN